MPVLSDESLVKCAELFEQNRDMYGHPAWRRLMDGLKAQAEAVKNDLSIKMLESEGKINTDIIYEYRGRWQALNFLHAYGTSEEEIGRTALKILTERALKHAE